MLGQRVDALGLSSITEKLKAIAILKFPKTLKHLKYSLGLTSWLRQYIPHCAQKSAPLQHQKIDLYKQLQSSGVTQGTKRLRQADKLHLESPTEAELESFHLLQKDFLRPTMLHHFISHRQLYADLDASTKGIGAKVYHATVDPPTSKSVQPIFFLSRLLKPTERHYWPTELELAALYWVVAKTRHLIEASKLPTIFYTDHPVSIQIATKTSMNTTSLVRMNPRHHQSSEFLSRFRIIVKHKPGKLNVVPDALSRLDTITEIPHTTHCPNSLQGPQKSEILSVQT
ncbi:hypothetical protein K3495_g607 [Podosphaera aphanis]|nr:hypothetical protein K3495_g607 [Podosphaera aphanis]